MARKRARARRPPPRRPVPRQGAGRPTSPPRLSKLPPLALGLMGLVLLVLANVLVQVVRKPTELLGLVFAPSPLTAEQTWARYGPIAREKSTDLVRAELLAALVQVESSGDPLAHTPWRWRWTLDPLRIYGPASSAVGLLQITDGTFEQARHYCIHGHRVVSDAGPLWDRCWFNALYFRTIPRHAIEVTSAWLHLGVEEARARRGAGPLSSAQRDALAATVHLCGRARAAALLSHGFIVRPGERCGGEELRAYLERVRVEAALFERMGSGGA